MSFEQTGKFNDYLVEEVMKYLVQKLETRYNSIIKFNKLLDTSNSSEAFYSLKKDFKLLFNDLEEDFRQGIFAIKALTSQNIKILDELKIKKNENKKIAEQLDFILSENKNLKMELIKFNENSSPKIIKNNSEKDINVRGQYNKYENENSNKKRNYTTKSNNRNMEKKKMEQYKKNNYEFEQLSNVKNIMDNMKKNKMKLKMAIEQHFNNNINNDNDN